MASTGKRVFLSSGAPLTLPGMTSTKGQSDQSRVAVAMICAPSFRVRQIVQENYLGGNLKTGVAVTPAASNGCGASRQVSGYAGTSSPGVSRAGRSGLAAAMTAP